MAHGVDELYKVGNISSLLLSISIIVLFFYVRYLRITMNKVV